MSRKAKICTISMDARLNAMCPLEKVWNEIEEKFKAGAIEKPDLFLLPEAVLSGLEDKRLRDENFYVVPGDGNCLKFSAFAQKYNAYVAASVLTLRNEKRYNSIIVFDRKGHQVFVYDKAYLTRPELDAGLTPGSETPDCFDADFGKIGFAICFDLNFRALFENYHAKGMELLLFPSYFPGGRILANIAFDFSCFAVSSHAQGDESVFIDKFGRESARANMFTRALTQTLELDCAVFHLSKNLDKVDAIRREYGDAINIEIHRPEAFMLLSIPGIGLSFGDLTAKYDLCPLDELKKTAILENQTRRT